jgi:hypothetical protein
MMDWLRRFYHFLIPVGVRRVFRFARFSAGRRARLGLWRRTGGRVAAGPFRGMLMGGQTPGECYGPELLGSYEADTHEWLETEIARGWSNAVNIGSNTGFYSTGLAIRLPGAMVYEYEMDAAFRAETQLAAERNGVASRVKVMGKADAAVLAALPLSTALVVCDCEGCERDVLDPTAVPWLARSALLVELHDFAAPGATAMLRGRFAATHDLTEVEQRPRDPQLWAGRAGILAREAAILAEERRIWDGERLGRWMLLTPRARGN